MNRDEIQSVWPHWQAVELIGQGGFGKVYKVKRETMNQTFYGAVKVIKIPSDEGEQAGMSTTGMSREEIREYYREVTERLLDEIRALETLKSASHIVAIEDHEIIENEHGIGWTIYIRMELLSNMEGYLQNHAMNCETAAKLGMDICTALEFCHDRQIIHRDIKPSNIFVSEFGEFKLGDFGIARHLEQTNATLSQKGTKTYMAPEMIRMEKYGKSVDIYALGLTMYELLNHGRMPFMPPYPQPFRVKDREEALYRRLSGEPFPCPSEADGQLGTIICKACAPRAEERYASATEMKRELSRWLAGEHIELLEERTAGGFGEEPHENFDEQTSSAFSQGNSGGQQTGTDERTQAAFGESMRHTQAASGKEKKPEKKKKSILITGLVTAAVVFAARCLGIFMADKIAMQGTQGETRGVWETTDLNLEEPAANTDMLLEEETDAAADYAKTAQINGMTDILLAGDEEQLYFQYDSIIMQEGPDLVWESSDTSVATVDEHSIVKAVAPGTVEIHAEYKGMSASATITVVDVDDEYGVRFNSDVNSIELGSGDAPENIIFEMADLQGDKSGEFTAYYYYSPGVVLNCEWLEAWNLEVSSLYSGAGTLTVILMPSDDWGHVVASWKIDVTVR